MEAMIPLSSFTSTERAWDGVGHTSRNARTAFMTFSPLLVCEEIMQHDSSR